MAEYASLAALRRAMTSSDPDDRVDAYMAARDVGVDPDDVLDQEPPVEELIAGGVIPEGEPERPPAAEQLQAILDTLERIEVAVGGSE